jgi:hypothetical protein
MEAATGYCGHDCFGYVKDPQPGHFWPEEEPELKLLAEKRKEKP